MSSHPLTYTEYPIEGPVGDLVYCGWEGEATIMLGRQRSVTESHFRTDDTWSEIGEYLIEGQPARKTFEMTVKRISEPP